MRRWNLRVLIGRDPLASQHADIAVGVALWHHDGQIQVAVVITGEGGRADVNATSEGAESVIGNLTQSSLSLARARWATHDGTPIHVVGTDGASVTIDHSPVGSIPYDGRLAPGVHHFTVSADGHVTERREVTIAAGTTPTEISFTLAAGSDPHHDDHSTNATSNPDMGWMIGGAVVLIAGAGVLAEGIITLADSEHCTAGCTGPLSDRVLAIPSNDAGSAFAIVGTIAMGLGIVAIVIGASVGASSSTARSQVTPTPNGVAISF